VTDLLLLMTGAAVGVLTYLVLGPALDRFQRDLQEAKLRALVRPTKVPGQPLFGGLSLLLEGHLIALPWKGNAYGKVLEDWIRRAALPQGSAPRVMVQQGLGSLLGGTLFLFLSMDPLVTVGGVLLGAFLPFLRLRDQALRREGAILRELPNALESLSLCSEAGLSLEQGLEQYVKTTGPGPLREEFTLVLSQARSGASRKIAFQEAALRIDLTDFGLFASSIAQAERFGTGIAKTLRDLSLVLRDKQVQRAEKAVQELPVKLLLPLVLCVMPVTFLILFGPVALQFMRP